VGGVDQQLALGGEQAIHPRQQFIERLGQGFELLGQVVAGHRAQVARVAPADLAAHGIERRQRTAHGRVDDQTEQQHQQSQRREQPRGKLGEACRTVGRRDGDLHHLAALGQRIHAPELAVPLHDVQPGGLQRRTNAVQ